MIVPSICVYNAYCTNNIAIPNMNSIQSCQSECASTYGVNVYSYNAQNNSDCRCAADSCLATTNSTNTTINVFSNSAEVNSFILAMFMLLNELQCIYCIELSPLV